MQKFARIASGLVAEIIQIAPEAAIEDMFHPEFVANLVALPGDPPPLGSSWNGQVFAAPSTTAQVPQEVTNFQARAVLTQMPGALPGRSLFDDVDDALRAAGGIAWQAWEYANTISRRGALVNAMAGQLGISEAQLDSLFIAAAAIEA